MANPRAAPRRLITGKKAVATAGRRMRLHNRMRGVLGYGLELKLAVKSVKGLKIKDLVRLAREPVDGDIIVGSAKEEAGLNPMIRYVGVLSGGEKRWLFKSVKENGKFAPFTPRYPPEQPAVMFATQIRKK